jgi:hypothetical protein
MKSRWTSEEDHAPEASACMGRVFGAKIRSLSRFLNHRVFNIAANVQITNAFYFLYRNLRMIFSGWTSE